MFQSKLMKVVTSSLFCYFFWFVHAFSSSVERDRKWGVGGWEDRERRNVCRKGLLDAGLKPGPPAVTAVASTYEAPALPTVLLDTP